MLPVRFFVSILALSLIASANAQEIETLVSPNEEIDGEFGWSVGGGGDTNTDGIPDIIVGAWTENPDSSPWNAGRAYVFSGDSLLLLHTLQSPNEEQAGGFGYAVDLLGDINGDGSDDIVVSAMKESLGELLMEAGRVYVFNGSDGVLLHTLVSPNAQLGGWFGFSLASAGDVNNDGTDDIIVGAHEEEPDPSPVGAGRAYIFSGSDGSVLHELQSPNDQNEGYFGYSVSSAGDLNEDGFYDVIVGARKESTGSSPDAAGMAYVFSGSDGSLLHTLMSPNEETEGYFGNAVSSTGDITGDGIPDLIVAADHEDGGRDTEDAGNAYVFDGQNGSLIFALSSPNEEEEGFFGNDVTFTGDMDGDGIDEIMVAAYWEVRDPVLVGAGRTYVFRGSDGSMLYTFESPTPEAGGFFGCSVDALGDLDENGSDDVVIGAVFENPGESPQDAGRAHVIFTESQVVDGRPGNSVLPRYAQLLSVSPNPVTDKISITYTIHGNSVSGEHELHLSLYDISGHLTTFNTDLQSENGTHRVVWPIREESLPSGYYILTLSERNLNIHDSAPVVIAE